MKITIAIIVAVLVIGGIWWFVSTNMANQQGAAGNANTMTGGNAIATTTTSAPALTSGTSNADLNQDLSQIDGQLNGLASDSASVDQGLNDQPVSQSSL